MDTKTSAIFIRRGGFLLAALVSIMLSCATSGSTANLFGEAPAGLSSEALAYREYLLKQVQHENQCVDGFPPMEGRWRVNAPQASRVPRNEIYFRGTQFTEFIADNPEKTEGKKREMGILRGWYACVGGNKIVLFVESVEPEGAFGNTSGSSYPCQVYWNPMTQRDTFALLCSFNWNPAESTGYSFQRVGH